MVNLSVILILFVQIVWNNLVYGASNEMDDEFLNELKEVHHGAPKIHPLQTDIELNVGEDFKLECESQSPVTWIVPEIFGNEKTEYIIFPTMSKNTERPFKTSLEIKSASVDDVRRFFCINNASVGSEEYDLNEEVELYKASSIYVFVNDPENLLVPIHTPVDSVRQYEDAIIPCKPTSKQVEVSLTKDESEIELEHYHYNPSVGFVIKIRDLSDGGFFVCTAKKDPNTQQHYQLEVTEASLTHYINKPKIVSETGEYVTIGQKFVLTCNVDVAEGINFDIKWILPNRELAENGNRIRVSRLSSTAASKTGFRIGTRNLTITKVNKEIDSGVYKCEVSDMSANKNHHIHRITVLDSNEGFLELKEDNGLHEVKTSEKKKKALIVLKYRSHPEPWFLWLNPKNETIEESAKYTIKLNETKKEISLTINALQLEDAGNYTLLAMNDITRAQFIMPLIVHVKPVVKMEPVYYAKPRQEVKFVCSVAGYPPSQISWLFMPCETSPKWPTCSAQAFAADSNVQPRIIQMPNTQHAQTGEYIFISSTPGKIECRAKNSEGTATALSELWLSDIDEAVSISVDQPHDVVTIGDIVTLRCDAVIYNHTNNIVWTKNNVNVTNSSDVTVLSETKQYTYEKKIIINNAQFSHDGEYICRAYDLQEEKYKEQITSIKVYEPKLPELLLGAQKEALKLEMGENLILVCEVEGIPTPMIQWFFNDELLDLDLNETRPDTNDNGKSIFIEYAKPEDTGLYKCEATNKVGQVSKEWTVEVTNTGAINKIWIYGILILIGILIIFIIYICIRLAKARRHVQEMKAAGLANFEEGDPDQINPDMALDEQADLLPYKSEFEFPREKLKLGKQLGAGAFGVVMKASAEGINPNEDETTVAVKMVKKQTDNEVMRALISELKIMVHLGQHLNVVNLLGAVTKNIAKREVMVIVEYCRFGNVQNFLLKHRPYFIDQINLETGEIDPQVQTNQMRWSKSGVDFNRQSTTGDTANLLNSKGYMRHSGMQNMAMIDSAGTEATMVSYVGGDGSVLSDNSNEPLWRSNYKMDYKGPVRPVTTTDLVCWASQVASGMDYLASRKVLHGDLAARNILLCDDNVVKICDFGLARSMYKSDNYKKKGEAPLPFKWLALECIGDNVFSTYSDVWAYGIVLWELFSLAKVPYPGMDANQVLYNKLRDGYRMDKPQYANQDIYDIMLNCWNVKPDSRPNFKDLRSRFNAMLPDDLRNHYIDLNEPYLAFNAEQVQRGETDYLANLGPPEEQAPSVPDYVNGIILPLPPISEFQNNPDYLMMSPSKMETDSKFDFTEFNQQQHSPTTKNNLDSSPQQGGKKHKKVGLPEEIPMLNTNSFGSDSEPEMSPKPLARTSIPQNQYVNITQAKQTNPKDAFSNPGYVTFKNINEREAQKNGI